MGNMVLYGGSFNPPHKGHISAAKSAMEFLKPERFCFLPDRIPPHKNLPEGSPDAAERLYLTQLAAQSVPGAEVLDIELHREGPSYTSDTLREIHTLYPETEITFLMGTDMLESFLNWHEPEVISSLATLGVFVRADDEKERVKQKTEELKEKLQAKVLIIEHNPIEISSSRIREMLPKREGANYLSDEVYGEIIRHRLYNAKPNFPWLREKSYSYLKPQRVPHVQGTEQEAIRLASRWSVNTEDAAEAAILHDITKKLEMEEQLKLCEKYGIMCDDLEQKNLKLLHSKTGACFSRDLFGISTEVEEAIRWHTTGRAEMTDLQKVIYLADYIEPTRSGFYGLEELRKLAYEDLNAAMLFGLRLSLDELKEKGAEPHRNSVMAERYFSNICKE